MPLPPQTTPPPPPPPPYPPPAPLPPVPSPSSSQSLPALHPGARPPIPDLPAGAGTSEERPTESAVPRWHRPCFVPPWGARGPRYRFRRSLPRHQTRWRYGASFQHFRDPEPHPVPPPDGSFQEAGRVIPPVESGRWQRSPAEG